MDGQGSRQDPVSSGKRSPVQTLWILWAAILMSIPIYAVLGVVVARNTPPPPDGIPPVFIPALAGVCVVTTLIVLVFAGRLFAGRGIYFTYCILRCALAESIAIYGFILTFMGAGAVAALFFVWGAVLLMIVMPTRSDRERFEAHKARLSGNTIG